MQILTGIIVTIVLCITSYECSPISAQQLTTSEWKNYSNNNLGISFEYPSDWNVMEKNNRFEDGPDIQVNKEFNSFRVQLPTPNNDDSPINFEAYVSDAKKGLSLVSIPKNLNLIEDFDFNKYSTNNKDTAAALYVVDSDLGKRLVEQLVLVNNGNEVFMLGYTDEPANFDSPQSQDIMNKIINSFKIIN